MYNHHMNFREYPNIPPAEKLNDEIKSEDRLGFVLGDLTDRLSTHENKLKSDETTIEFLSLPYGQAKDGFLNFRLSNEGDESYGDIRFFPIQDDPDRGFHFRRNPDNASWQKKIRLKNGKNAWKNVSLESIVQHLDYNQPFDSDTLLLSDIVHKRTVSSEDLLAIANAFSGEADHVLTKNRFNYRDISLDPDGNRRTDTALEFSIKKIDDEIRETRAVFTLPYEVDGIDTSVKCSVISTPIGLKSIDTFYLNPTDNRLRRVKIDNEANLANAVENMLAEFMTEKFSSLSN